MRTWGQIRQTLRQRFKTLELDLLNSAIITAYNDILSRQTWSQLAVTGWIRTLPRVDTTGVVVKGSITITGGAFLPDWVGRWVQISTGTARYRIVEYAAGNLLLDRPYDGETEAAAAMVVYQPRYSMPLEAKSITSFPEIAERWTVRDLETNGVANSFGQPQAWIPIESDEEETLQVEFYPVPTNGVALAVRYAKSVRFFDGSNTQEKPVAWVSDDAILAKATAICCAEPSVQEDPTFHMAEFERYLARMTVADSQRSTPQKMRLEARLTKHDRERQSR
jgi:hypothetical protein